MVVPELHSSILRQSFLRLFQGSIFGVLIRHCPKKAAVEDSDLLSEKLTSEWKISLGAAQCLAADSID